MLDADGWIGGLSRRSAGGQDQKKGGKRQVESDESDAPWVHFP